MVWIVPTELEDAVHAAARAQLGDGLLATAALTRAIIDRSRRYTSERDRLAANTAGDLAARALFFTVADAMKIAVPLGELTGRGALPAGVPAAPAGHGSPPPQVAGQAPAAAPAGDPLPATLRIVDLGAGCGAMSLGAIAALTEHAPAAYRLDITAIDRDAPALAIARDAIRQLAARRGIAATVTTRDDDVARARIPSADLIAIGSVLNELPAAARLDLVTRALAAIASDGCVIIIEPALRDTARALHELRDAIVAAGTGHVFAPCTRGQAPCPALGDPDDWCHEDRPLALPRRTAELARLTHLRDGGMKFAYLVLRRHQLALAGNDTAWRVVSAPMPAKGKREVIGCSAAGRMPIRLLRRHRGDRNRSFDDAGRGDVLVVGAAPGPDRLEIGDDTEVTRLTPALPARE